MVQFAFDMPLEELRECRLPQTREPDFDEFWKTMLERSAQQELGTSSEKLAYPIESITVERATFNAFDGGTIVGWYLAPDDCERHPALAIFHGYGGHRGKAADYLMWALQGFACLAIDVRGQNGESTDGAAYPGGRTPGWMSAGLLDPQQYYFTRVFLDSVRTVDYLCERPEVDGNRIGVLGGSQGGGLAMAVAALDSRPSVCLAEVPGFCHFGRTLEITRSAPWGDLFGFLQHHPEHIETAMRTLSYVELNNHAENIRCPTLVSVGLLDDICVPSSIFSAYNRIPVSEKQIDVYPFNGHEGGMNREEQLVWARRHLLGN